MQNKIVAVIVTYHPELDALTSLLNRLAGQVSSVVIIDNGSDQPLAALLKTRAHSQEYFDPLGKNLGIAVAQNKGINWARQQGADYVVLFDQDSEPAPDMVACLLAVAEEKSASGETIAAVGPRYLDPRQENPPPFIRIRGLQLERLACPQSSTVVPVDYLIASGCLIPMAVLNKVGGMRDDLFIDYVDIEWGLRARHHGFQSYGVCAATMAHSLGDHPLRFFGRSIPLHSPLRHYYHFRNAVLLYRENWVSLNWKLVDGWRLVLKYGFYTLFANPRLEHCRMMTLGLWHGLRCRVGKLERDL